MSVEFENSNEIALSIDGRDVTVPRGTTIWEAARFSGIEIPVLCHSPNMEPVGVCRMCVVDVGERVLAASCRRECAEGMCVQTSSPTIQRHRQMLTRLLLCEHPVPCARERTTADCELERLARGYGLIDADESTDLAVSVSVSVSACRIPHNLDKSSPVIAVDHTACILCDRCIRACDDLQANDIIGRSGKGATARISFDLNNPMGESGCVSCGECVASCPTGALTNREISLPIVTRDELTATETVCPYCGVGCAVTVHSRKNQIVFVEGRESPVNQGRLCVKGRYGWDYTMHPQRLTKPLIRREDFYPKGPLSPAVRSSTGDVPANGKRRRPGGVVSDSDVLPAFREATWEETLEFVARRFLEIRHEQGSGALAGFGSAKCSNEEAYLFQKLVRGGFGTNNVDHCTRLCHASSVAALMETIGSGAVTNVFADVKNADVALITGTNTAANHPVAATFIKNAVRNGTKLIMVDVRRHELADFATHFAQIKPGSDVAFYNGVMHVLIRDRLIDEEFIANRTEGFAELKTLLFSDFSPQAAAEICGVKTEEIEAIAHTIGGKAESGKRKAGQTDDGTPSDDGTPAAFGSPLSALPRMLIFWGMGISQHTHGTDNARCLISLCLLTGNMGKPGTGLHPLRGQNNVQGASDAGLIPMVYPDYQPVTNPTVREKFERVWGVKLDPQPGLTVVEIMDGALEKRIRGLYIMGENPFISDPNTNKVRKALSSLDFLVIQDIFLTETAEFADVILPAGSYFEKTGTYTNTDRRVQLGKKVLASPGEAQPDWQILCEIGKRFGLSMDYESTADVFEEFASLTKNYRGLSHANLGDQGKLWPCANPASEEGTQILFGESFPTANGRGKFVPCSYTAADELPDVEYPFVLTTGRILEHWHTGSMTRRSFALSTIQPNPFVKMHPADVVGLGMQAGDTVRVSSRRGQIELELQDDLSMEPGVIFIPFHFREAAANILTNDALDPDGKIPEFKFCAVAVEPVAD